MSSRGNDAIAQRRRTVIKNLIVGAALTLSTFAVAAPPHRAVPAVTNMGVRGDVFDVEQGRRLQRELDQAIGRRDLRHARMLDLRIGAFMEAELVESRREQRGEFDRRERREEKQSTKQLTRLLKSFRRVEGQVDFRSMNEKRRLLAEAVNIAERDLRDARQDRFGRR
jgi:hypothetical protein